MIDLNQTVHGWKDKRSLAHEKRDQRNNGDKAAIRAERERMYQEQAEAGRQAAKAQEAALEAETCQCTACGGTGRLTIAKAMGVVDAMDRYGFGGHQPSKHAMAALAHIARGEDAPPGSRIITFTYGSISPAPVTPGPDTVLNRGNAAPVASVAPMAPVALDNVLKPAKGKAVKPAKLDSGLYLIDGDDD